MTLSSYISNGGTLTNTGTLGIASTRLNLNQGATLVSNGSQRYSLLTTSEPGAATWRGKDGEEVADGVVFVNREVVKMILDGGGAAKGVVGHGGDGVLTVDPGERPVILSRFAP